MKGSKIRNASDHLKIFSEIGGISFNPAIFPTMKFPDQNRAAKKSKIEAIIILLLFSSIKQSTTKDYF